MRGFALVIGLGTLAACSTGPVQATRTPQGQRQFEQLVAGKVPGPPVNCLQSYDMNDMVVIDESTVAYRLGGSRVYINHLQGVCNGLGRNAIMVTRSLGPTGTCAGDIVQMVDQGSRMTTGGCAMGEFIPYTRPR